MLDQERRLLNWAASAVEVPVGVPEAVAASSSLDRAQAQAAGEVAGTARLVLVVGPAGTGKTTTLAAAVASLQAERRPVLGVAPSGKAADVLATQAGCHAVTLAKLMTSKGTGAPPGTTVLLDEAGMASTEDLHRLVAMAQQHRWRLVCVGDPEQLPAVGRGGVFAHWCDTLPAVRLEEVRRFAEPWEADASLLLRAGQRRGVDAYAERGRLHATHPALVAERVARRYRALAAKGHTVAVTTTTAATARAVNLAIQHAERHWHTGPSVHLADGTRAWAGDRIATRRNDRNLVTDAGADVRNRQTWTVTAVGPDGSLTVQGQQGGVSLPADYVARHVELGWAVTGYGNQGVTVDHGICVVEPISGRAGVYVGMTRGRLRNDAFVLDRVGAEDPAEALATIVERPANARTAHAVRGQLHGHAVIDPLDEHRRITERLNRLQRRPPPDRVPLGLA